METVTKIEQSNVLQNFSLLASTVGWELSKEDCLVWMKVATAGITDAVNMFKNKSTPIAIVVQDLKGNKIIYACIQWVAADDDDETATGNWSYYWSWDTDDIPEGATVYTLDQEQVQRIILHRGYEMVTMQISQLSFISQLCVYMFSLIKDALDQQAVEEGGTWTLELDGYFEASVEVVNGQKEFSFMPKGEMKMLIKDDAGSEK